MPSRNGHRGKRAALYARVSTEDQAGEDKTSLSEQLLYTRRRADTEGCSVNENHVIAEEVNGRKSITQGLEKLRALAEAGDIDVVIVYKWNRLARSVAKYEGFIGLMKLCGVDVVSLDGQANDTPTGKMFNRMMAVFSEFQRDDLVKTMQDGKLGQARRGNIVPGRFPPYGFVYNPVTRTYDVDEARMIHAAHLFRMVGVEGKALWAVKRAFDRDGVPTPAGGRYWNPTTIGRVVRNDIYRPHSAEELRALVEAGNLLPGTAAEKIMPGRVYGIYWYNRRHVENDPDGGGRSVTHHPEDERIAVPVDITDAGIELEWVEGARAAVRDNVVFSKAGGREWPLQNRLYCPCGSKMQPETTGYYVCRRHRSGKDACPHAGFRQGRADKLEQRIEGFVSGLTSNPETFRAQVTAQVEAERKRYTNPAREIEAWQKQITKADTDRAKNQEMFRADAMTIDELQRSNAELDKRKATAQAELERLRDTERRITELADIPRRVEAHLHELSLAFANHPLQETAPANETGGNVCVQVPPPEEVEAERASAYRDLYRLMDLKGVVEKDGTLELTWRGGSQVLRTPR
ncbi:MAG: recombinase family protein [Actinomycetota bacterium]|nr:recombinase family protein [Actinomycetota bacterium]